LYVAVAFAVVAQLQGDPVPPVSVAVPFSVVGVASAQQSVSTVQPSGHPQQGEHVGIRCNLSAIR
jgi:hypothetical protein